MSRGFWTRAALHTVLGGVLCFVPLFDLLGYEYSFAVGLLAALTSYGIGEEAGSRSPFAGGAFARAAGLAIAQLLGGLVLISLNALRVRNCDFGVGLGLFVMGPGFGAVYGASLGVAAARVVPAHRRRLRGAVEVFLVGGPLLVSLWRLFWEPPIFVYDHLWGFFAGSLYDEGVGISDTLIDFRTVTAVRIAALVLAVAAWERRAFLHRTSLAAAALAAFGAFGLDHVIGADLGYFITRADVVRELPVVVDRPGLVLHLPRGTDAARQRMVADDHAFRLAQLRERLDLHGPLDPPIHSFVYKDERHKARWMGGGNTQVARPWLREIHIHGVHDHHYATGHELVHILAAEFGSSVLRVSWKGLMINMGLVEGVAEALTLREGSADLHTYARAMREAGLAPDVRQIMNPAGFWSQAPRRAYTVAGSFVRWLIDTRGVQRFKRVYKDGDFRAAYDEDLESLVSAWESTIDALPLLPRDRLEARHLFRRRSIFQRPCAHVIADLRARARRANPGEALRLQRRVCAFEGETPAARTELAEALLRAGKDKAYVELTDELLADPSLSPRHKVDLYENRGARAWKRGELDEARHMFEAALGVQESLPSERLNWVRLWALDRPEPERELLRRFLSDDISKLVAVLELEHLWQADRAALTYPYLIARQLQQNGAWEAALDYLEAARGHPFLPIESERVRMVAEIQAVRRRWNEARAAFAAYADVVPAAGERAYAHDEIERVDFWERGAAAGARAPRPGDDDDPSVGARDGEPDSDGEAGGSARDVEPDPEGDVGGVPIFSRTNGDPNRDAEVNRQSDQPTGGDRDSPSETERGDARAGDQPAGGDDGI